ncbi:hypothetical protein RHMOL_Rhmol07G0021800 [Rhododendron molle]|uniref:Uncharacterized protein n=1 Tax=Rhododendron molle TaxID=49168 RepID=A0ACC0MY13_RHOML|nr:hypothetical protein RHMOL_Rhmol07G0021800 [Rhododendron molle]
MAVLGAAGGGALKLLRCFSPDEVPWRRSKLLTSAPYLKFFLEMQREASMENFVVMDSKKEPQH